MLAGKLYDPADPELAGIRAKAHKLSQDYNATYDTDEEKRQRIIDELLPHHADGCYLQGPIYFDYGTFTKTGKNFYANFNLTVLDSAPVTIGELHDQEYARPITIGNDCWIASNVVICGGVTIGDRVVIGAGSVVTRDIPSDTLAAGNPCRPLRPITEKDRIIHHAQEQ